MRPLRLDMKTPATENALSLGTKVGGDSPKQGKKVFKAILASVCYHCIACFFLLLLLMLMTRWFVIWQDGLVCQTIWRQFQQQFAFSFVSMLFNTKFNVVKIYRMQSAQTANQIQFFSSLLSIYLEFQNFQGEGVRLLGTRTFLSCAFVEWYRLFCFDPPA